MCFGKFDARRPSAVVTHRRRVNHFNTRTCSENVSNHRAAPSSLKHMQLPPYAEPNALGRRAPRVNAPKVPPLIKVSLSLIIRPAAATHHGGRRSNDRVFLA